MGRSGELHKVISSRCGDDLWAVLAFSPLFVGCALLFRPAMCRTSGAKPVIRQMIRKENMNDEKTRVNVEYDIVAL